MRGGGVEQSISRARVSQHSPHTEGDIRYNSLFNGRPSVPASTRGQHLVPADHHGRHRRRVEGVTGITASWANAGQKQMLPYIVYGYMTGVLGRVVAVVSGRVLRPNVITVLHA